MSLVQDSEKEILCIKIERCLGSTLGTHGPKDNPHQVGHMVTTIEVVTNLILLVVLKDKRLWLYSL